MRKKPENENRSCANSCGLGDAKASGPATSGTSSSAHPQSGSLGFDDQFGKASNAGQPPKGGQSSQKLDGRDPGLLLKALKSGTLGRIRWDDFNWRLVRELEGKRIVLDEHEMTRLLCDLQAAGFDRVSEKTLRSVVLLAGRDDACDAGQDWLDSLIQWDGRKRIKTFLHVYFGTPDDAYHAATSLYMWTGMVTRIKEPGRKADMVPVFVGEQGVGKSTALRIMAGPSEHLGETALTDRPNRLFRKCIGKTVVVSEEMRGIRGKCDADEVKTRITSPTIETDDKNGFGMQEYLRRFLIFGTTNRTDFLRDVTGHRRYLPFTVERVDREKLIADLDQLWAEARHTYDQRCRAGLCPIAFEDAERLAPSVYARYERATRWGECEELISWIDSGPPPFKMADALRQVGITPHNSSSYWQDQRDMAATLRQLGCVQSRPTIAGRATKMWCAPQTHNPADVPDIGPWLRRMRNAP